MGKLRKQLSAPGLLNTVRKSFGAIVDPRRQGAALSLVDALMSGVAVFSLKYPSLLQFEHQRDDPVEAHHLRTLYGIEQVPCDTQMRTMIDEVEPHRLRPAFKALFASLQRGKGLEAYQ